STFGIRERKPVCRLVIDVIGSQGRPVGIGFLGEAVEDIPGIRGGDGGGAGLVGGGGLATGKIAAIVIAIANRACSIGAVVRIGARGDLDFRIAFADKARESVICEGAQAAAILDHTDEIAECVISVGCDVSQATGIFRDLREAAEAVEGALALSASGV